MRDMSKEDLRLFRAERPGEADAAIRELARQVAELTGLLDEMTKALLPLAEQHKAVAGAVAMLTRLHPPGPALAESGAHPWPSP